MMRRFISITILCVGILMNADAQNFTQRIQQPKTGQGTITIHESTEIDQLVNSATLGAVGNTTTKNKGNENATSSENTRPSTSHPTVSENSSPEQEAAPVDLSKKVMRGYKVNGYRVQAFAGGNSRKDRQQAEQIGNDIKAHFADVPVYVHFYSPRWICRVGNFRTYEEAHQMLISLRKLGYTQASIVKGKITVQY